MQSITLTDALLVVLRKASALTELRDSTGAVVGFFAPVAVERAHLYAQAAVQVDPTEVRKRKDAGGKTHSTQEVLDHLKTMETP